MFPFLQRIIGCGNFETTEGLRTDSPAGDVDLHNIVCSWSPQAHVPMHSCDFTNGHFQVQEIDRILLYRVPAEGIPEEGIARKPIRRTMAKRWAKAGRRTRRCARFVRWTSRQASARTWRTGAYGTDQAGEDQNSRSSSMRRTRQVFDHNTCIAAPKRRSSSANPV